MLTSVTEGGLRYGIGMGLRGACKVNPRELGPRCACSRFWRGLWPTLLATGIRGMGPQRYWRGLRHTVLATGIGSGCGLLCLQEA